ncbi:DUF6290 family protein [Candidatus Saccharibacteria bacterium]|nr:DUF6290 family protein [Candidatus Saccharibacteria bacterium]MCL1962934.1 DUF6290 family protein [Candidatus Saccharibacteria bacterium]
MTSITIRTDERIKNILERKAELNGLTLSGYLNLMIRHNIVDDDDIDFIDEKHMRYYVAEADKVMRNPNTKWHDAREVLAELDKKYGLSN